MYLSRVVIDFENRQKIKELSHLGAIHNWVEQSFIQEDNTYDDTRKLWRIDTLKDENHLLVVSKNRPNLTILETFGVKNSAKTKDYNKFLSDLDKNTIYNFRVTLNPVISLSTGKHSGKRGKIVPHITIEQQMEFLRNRSTQHGFVLLDNALEIVNRKYLPLKHSNGKPINVSVVTYEGKLMIDDLSLFRNTLINGIGRKKAYGCGLLTVIPVANG